MRDDSIPGTVTSTRVACSDGRAIARATGDFIACANTGKPAFLPVGLHAATNGMTVNFSDALDPASATDAQNYAVKAGRSTHRAIRVTPRRAHSLPVAKATLATDRKSVFLELPDIRPTWCMEIKCAFARRGCSTVERRIHNTVHHLGDLTKRSGRSISLP